MQRKKLTDVLQGNDRERLNRAWDTTKAATDFEPLPTGEYVARVVQGALTTAKTGTLGYKLTFEVLEGEHAGRRFWYDLWLTEPAMPMSKRDLSKLGVTSLDQLDTPLPRGIRCKVQVTFRQEDDGRKYNRVKSFEVISIDKPERDPFAPAEEKEVAA
jgi:hypothetical protein